MYSKIWRSLILITLPLTFVGCGNNISTYCEDLVDCGDGNDTDIQACESLAEGAKNAAGDYGCAEEFDSLMECFAEKGDCQNGVFFDTSRCDDEEDDLGECQDDASGY